MNPSASAPDAGATPFAAEVDVLVIGAGITGIYQLYRARDAGFSVQLLEAGGGVGGTWYWNRYPGARFDSESYSYGYLFSRELFDDWEWQEHFAGQPETERYLNHVVDRFDLRRHMRFDAKVVAAVYDESSGTWIVTVADGTRYRTRFLVAASGSLSVPYIPDVPGRDEFRGEQYHPARWPAAPVEFAGKRVAVVGTGSSGVQVMPVIAEEAASVTVYQRTPTWCTPLNNSPITPEEQSQLRADFDALVEVLNTSASGFHHELHDRSAFEDSKEERWEFFERLWNSPGFRKLTSNYRDVMLDRDANAEWCEFIAEKIRTIVHDADTAEALIPKDHLFGEKRPPFVAGYYEAFNLPHVSLVDLMTTPIVRVTADGIETAAGEQPFDMIVWATGFDFGTGALTRMGIRGRNGLALEDDWIDGPKTYMGIQVVGFPNLFIPAGPHAAAGNNPRYNSDQVDFIMDLLVRAREEGNDSIEVDVAAEEAWDAMIDKYATITLFGGGPGSQYFGDNIPGKARRYLLNSGGRVYLFAVMAEQRENDFNAFRRWRSESPGSPPLRGASTAVP
jgi:cation diffusion facilitator CzcD-associated flavoprotein CzcO